MNAPILLSVVAMIAASARAQNNNCNNAVQVCNDATFSGSSSGPGTPELTNANRGCLNDGEHQSSWYYFQPVTSGTVALTIQTGYDYDFAIWKTGNCANLGAPVRCSYSSRDGNTGMMVPYAGTTSLLGCGFLFLQPCSGLITTPYNAVDQLEGSGGDGWVNALDVTAGQTYILLVDNFQANSTAFTLDWNFTNGASLNCAPVPLPIALAAFSASYEASANTNRIVWRTESERFNDHFTLERSTDGFQWTIVDQQAGEENSVTPIDYYFDDYTFEPGKVNYYRLSQTDYDGTVETFDVISVNNKQTERTVLKAFNTMGQQVSPDTHGILILMYEDGTTRRVLQ